MVTLGRHRLDHLLLLEDNLLEGPATLHPSLQVLLNFFVSHLPPLNLFSDSPSLLLHRLNLNLKTVTFDLTDGLESLLEVGFTAPRLF